ncbi:hypothetical protein LBMAG53_38170 [Planctomycetota bacterium]|nr:hypothetical protein LBMAG53_38170 [Planctomycetota bacterium]
MLRSLILCCCSLIILTAGEALNVQGVGRCETSHPSFREVALTEALVDAARKGGVEIESTTKSVNFQIAYDQVFARASAAVRGWTKQSEVVHAASNIYELTISATVAPGDPKVTDELAMINLVRMKGSPRLALAIDEQIKGVVAGTRPFARPVVEAAAQRLKLNLVDVGLASEKIRQLAQHAEAVGRTESAKLFGRDLPTKADLLLTIAVTGEHRGTIEDTRGNRRQAVFIGAELRLVDPGLGQVLVTEPVPQSPDPLLLAPDQPIAAATEQAINHLLAGLIPNSTDSPLANEAPLLRMFRRIVANWTVEVDLGGMSRLNLTKATRSEWNVIKDALGKAKGVSVVIPREFDADAISWLDLAARDKVDVLADLAAEATKGRLGVTRTEGSNAYLDPVPQTASATTAATATGDLPAWVWPAVAVLAIVVIAVVVLARRK